MSRPAVSAIPAGCLGRGAELPLAWSSTCIQVDGLMLPSLAQDAAYTLLLFMHAGLFNSPLTHSACIWLLPPTGLYNTYLVPRGFSDINVNDTALDITAFAVSLLLVFRYVARGSTCASSNCW